MEIWTKALITLRQGKRAILLIVVENKGSSPGKQGFKMLVTQDEKFYGSIGGGATEHKMVERAKQMLKEDVDKAEMHRHVHDTEEEKERSGMICSGEHTVLLYPLNKAHIDNINEIITAITLKHDLTIKLSTESFNLHLSAAIDRQYVFSEEKVYKELIGYKHRVLIFGGGHVGLALTEQLKMLDFHITVFDNREDLDTFKNNSFADEKQIIKYNKLSNYIPDKKDVYAVISSFSHVNDKKILAELIKHNIKYIGMMGSKNKVKEIFAQLEEEGVSKDDLKKVTAPIGVNIKSQTPKEIAVSIAAQLIDIRNTKD